ncbi:MAG: metallophosphoesterase [Bacteroidales bacterium]|jgi:predicted MPP superfamily phosphohydrolase|nr:metallophosphoesterase [Bacteroidales bacterium]
MKYFFVYILLFYLLANVYLFVRGWMALERLPFLRFFFTIVVVVLLISPFLAIALEGSFSYHISLLTNKLAYSWMILFIYLFLLTICFDLLGLLFVKTHIIQGYIANSRDKVRLFVFLGILIFVFLTAVGGYIRFIHPNVTDYQSITSLKNSGNPIKKRVVFVSDMHLGYVITKNDAQKFTNLINAQKPDIVIFGGDLIDRSLLPVFEEKMYEELVQINASDGVFGVYGNHERISNQDSLVNDFYQKCNIRLLKDEKVVINGKIALFGRDDATNKKRVPVDAIAQGIDTSQFNIIVDHQPSDIDNISQTNTDLLLCGHTHNGQIFPGNWIVNRLFKLAHGKKKFNNTEVIVSSGIGVCGGKFRIGTSSEIVVFEIVIR